MDGRARIFDVMTMEVGVLQTSRADVKARMERSICVEMGVDEFEVSGRVRSLTRAWRPSISFWRAAWRAFRREAFALSVFCLAALR